MHSRSFVLSFPSSCSSDPTDSIVRIPWGDFFLSLFSILLFCVPSTAVTSCFSPCRTNATNTAALVLFGRTDAAANQVDCLDRRSWQRWSNPRQIRGRDVVDSIYVRVSTSQFACFERLYRYIQNFQGDEDCGNSSLVHPPFVSRRRRRWLIEQVLLHLRRRNRRRGILSVFLSPLNSSFELRRGPSPPPPSRSLVPFLSD